MLGQRTILELESVDFSMMPEFDGRHKLLNQHWEMEVFCLFDHELLDGVHQLVQYRNLGLKCTESHDLLYKLTRLRADVKVHTEQTHYKDVFGDVLKPVIRPSLERTQPESST